MFASLKKLFARSTHSTKTPARTATLAVESLETREVPAGLNGFSFGVENPTTIGSLKSWNQVTNRLAGPTTVESLETREVPAGLHGFSFGVENPTTIGTGWNQVVNSVVPAGLNTRYNLKLNSSPPTAVAGDHFSHGGTQEPAPLAVDAFINFVKPDGVA